MVYRLVVQLVYTCGGS